MRILAFASRSMFNDNTQAPYGTPYSSFLLSLCLQYTRSDDGSSLPINFPSTMLVSERPITSNNGHPRAIYRVCAARMSPKEILRPPRNSEVPHQFRHRSPLSEFPVRFVQSDIAVASFVPKERTCNVQLQVGVRMLRWAFDGPRVPHT